jgi:hypothetical protein
MKRLVAMLARIVAWGAFGAGVGFVGMTLWNVFTVGEKFSVSFNSTQSKSAAGIGAIAGGVAGFFRRT